MTSSQFSDLAFTPALEQARLIRDRQISPLELTELYLSRIQQYDPQLGSFFYVAAESAIADARQKTEQLAQTSNTQELPPFFGVPIGIKDLKSVARMPLSYGIAALKDNISNYDDGVVTKIKQAGFIILGKTATSELGSFPYTEAWGFPATRNPWNVDYTPGGSSGGSSSAVAAGLCPIALGGDAGGSIRGPAFCCGLVGIKPSRGRVSHAPVGDRQNGISTNGMLARTVADAAAFLDLISGYITGDPYWLHPPQIPFLAATKLQLPQLKIAVTTSILPVGEVAPECRQAVLQVAKILESMGHFIETQPLDVTKLIEPFKTVWAAGVASAGIPPEALSEMNSWVLEQSGSAGQYLQAVTQMQLIARQIISLFDRFDVSILPTYMHPTIKVGQWQDLKPEDVFNKIVNWVLPCPPFNATGQPAINIPVGFDSNGVPLGVQIVGKPTQEQIIIALASSIEAAQPWQHLRPKIGN
ncbi:MAG: amidase [Pleurocapsa sp.]